MSSISESWDRIHGWLQQHAPRIFASLNPGASPSELDSAENAIGMPLLSDWRELYSIHNGMSHEHNNGSLFHGMNFLTLSRVVTEVTQSRECALEGDGDTVAKADSAINTSDMNCDHWIPLAHDWGELLLKVDLAPESVGDVGQVIFADYTYRVAGLVAPSIKVFLNDFANDLEAGRYVLNADAFEDGNEFLDCDGDIDVVNWWSSPKWKHLER